MKSSNSTFALRLPSSLKAEAESLIEKEGTSLNTLFVVAIAEKISAMRTADFFESRAAKADLPAFRSFLRRSGGEPPREGDEIPKGWKAPKTATRSKSNKK